MADPARRREKQRLKRKRKAEERRRSQSVSLYRRIGQLAQPPTCLVNADWRKEGIASICLHRSVPGGGMAMAAFLVDLWCCGLKDAYGQLETDTEMYRERLARVKGQLNMVPMPVEQVRGLVAGGIRFAQQNGFRLPPKYERWVEFLGGVGDWRTADLSDFYYDKEQKKLHFVGPPEQLRKRLISGDVAGFLARPDVYFTSPLSFAEELPDDRAEDDLQEDGEPDDEGEWVEAEDEAAEEAADGTSPAQAGSGGPDTEAKPDSASSGQP